MVNRRFAAVPSDELAVWCSRSSDSSVSRPQRYPNLPPRSVSRPASPCPLQSKTQVRQPKRHPRDARIPEGQDGLPRTVLDTVRRHVPIHDGQSAATPGKAERRQSRQRRSGGISVDPYRDTPARIAAYAKLIGANFQIWTETGPNYDPVHNQQRVRVEESHRQGGQKRYLTRSGEVLGLDGAGCSPVGTCPHRLDGSA